MASENPKAAPWKKLFSDEVGTLAMPTFSLATNALPSLEAKAPTPHVRTIVFRGFYGNLPNNPQNPCPGHQDWDSNLLSYTLDKRTEKYSDLGDAEGVQAGPTELGEIEGCFWIPSPSDSLTGTQWRLRGRCVILPKDWDTSTEPIRNTVEWLKKDMWTTSDNQESFSFAKEYKAHFGNLSPGLRGTFKAPPPATPVALGNQGPGLGPDQIINDDEIDDELAFSNFRVAVIQPSRVEYVDLAKSEKFYWLLSGSDEDNRYGYKEFGSLEGNWRKIEIWP